jgi:hypothetical protein
MLQTKIVSILEPRTYSADAASLSWELTAGLRTRNTSFALTDAAGAGLAKLVGLSPTLQIIPALVGGRPAFLYFMKGMFDVADDVAVVTLESQPETVRSLADGQHKMIGVAYLSAPAQHSPARLLVLHPSLGDIEPANVGALQTFAQGLASTLWQAEPIHRTTHNLYLATNGQFLNRHEMSHGGLTAASLTVDNGTTGLTPGTHGPHISLKRWSGAGQVNRSSYQAASESSSTCQDHSSSDSTGSSDTGSGGSGTDTGGGGMS